MIDLLFRQGTGLASLGIEVFSAGEFSHVDARVPAGGVVNIPWPAGSLVGERSDAVGGKPPGLQCRPADYERAKELVLFHLPATPEQEVTFWSALYAEEGHTYDKRGILGFATDQDWHTPGTYFCSAAQLDGLQQADRMPSLYSPWWKITPVCLANLVAAQGAWWEALPI